ncbi:MerR family transcriptional regulator [Streptococcus sp. ZJ151]|uniref:MerR family transcriptional regulator n=1 Tax=Streptococcus jiangjianxini TaxID=3161189 RepID=UPI0032EDC6BC
MPTIKAISEMIGISAYAIRFYEKEGMVEIARNSRGIRQFDDASIGRLKAIAHYRRVGMSIEDIRRILGEYHNHALSIELLEKTQLELENQIAELQETHRYLMAKIEIHRRLAELEKQSLSDAG